MSLKYCQGTKCHTHFTKDRLKGTKGNKHYETRRRSSFYYGNGNFCSMRRMHDWLEQYADQAIITRKGTWTKPNTDTQGKHFVSKDGNDIFVYWDLDATPNDNGNQWRQATNPMRVRL